MARDLGLWKERTFRENELTETFNDEAEFVQRVDDGGDDGTKYRPGRGRGYGYDRDSE